jgi:alkanesulfonate monooxygenase SsuD/methylene tetrahydromethanopterin reductase-like flavin-dependent oxidoreductase (luciferase family)
VSNVLRRFPVSRTLPVMQLADLSIFTEPQQGATYDDLLAVAQRAEQLGFGAFFRSDHYLAIGDGDGMPGRTDA